MESTSLSGGTEAQLESLDSSQLATHSQPSPPTKESMESQLIQLQQQMALLMQTIQHGASSSSPQAQPLSGSVAPASIEPNQPTVAHFNLPLFNNTSSGAIDSTVLNSLVLTPLRTGLKTKPKPTGSKFKSLHYHRAALNSIPVNNDNDDDEWE